MHTITSADNDAVYKDPHIITAYTRANYLEPAEQTIRKLLAKELRKMRMLDIAVGGGRTTEHFAPLTKSYTGTDYSTEMVAACKSRFNQRLPNAKFFVADMRSMEIFKDHSFDFVLISFNAISALSHEDRLRVFTEVHRICARGGYLLFSAHNLQCIKKLFGYIEPLKEVSLLHPKRSYWLLRRWTLRKFIYNHPTTYRRIKNANYAVINDGAHDFRLQHYYVRPAEQLNQLDRHFEKMRIYSRDGTEVLNTNELAHLEDDWLFYFCVNK